MGHRGKHSPRTWAAASARWRLVFRLDMLRRDAARKSAAGVNTRRERRDNSAITLGRGARCFSWQVALGPWKRHLCTRATRGQKEEGRWRTLCQCTWGWRRSILGSSVDVKGLKRLREFEFKGRCVDTVRRKKEAFCCNSRFDGQSYTCVWIIHAFT